MRFHSAGRSLRWGADDECIVRLISTSKKCGGYGYQRCVYVCVCVSLSVIVRQAVGGESKCVCVCRCACMDCRECHLGEK